MTDRVTNLPASVHQRLLNVAQREGVELEYLLVRYANERFLYRLSQAEARDQFVLKGAMVFMVWEPAVTRQSRDVDLLGLGPMAEEQLGDIVRTLCELDVEDDGLRFDADSVRLQEIREQTDYGGVRVRLSAHLGSARVPLQIDVAFGDAVSPGPEETDLPTLLDFPAPRLRTYPRETVVAEKFEAMVRLGAANTRLKDFYDVWSLARSFEFEGVSLAAAVEATFRRRRTDVPAELPIALGPEFASRTEPQWRAFCRRVDAREQPSFADVIDVLREFLVPIYDALTNGHVPVRWEPSVGWAT